MSDEDARPSLRSRLKGYSKEAPFFCKISELILCVIAVGLIVDPFNTIPQDNLNNVAIVYISLGSYILINTIFVFSHLLGERIPKKTVLMFSGMAAILCCVTGIVLIREWMDFPNNLISRYLDQYSDQIVSSSFFAFLAALVFTVDTYLVYKYQ